MKWVQNGKVVWARFPCGPRGILSTAEVHLSRLRTPEDLIGTNVLLYEICEIKLYDMLPADFRIRRSFACPCQCPLHACQRGPQQYEVQPTRGCSHAGPVLVSGSMPLKAIGHRNRRNHIIEGFQGTARLNQKQEGLGTHIAKASPLNESEEKPPSQQPGCNV